MASKCVDLLSNLHSTKDSGDIGNIEFNFTILKPLDEVLRCRICFEYFNNCMSTKCSHNYCSVCIRRYMTYKSQCPTCFQEASEPELRSNRLVDEVLRLYIKIRESLQNPVQPEYKPPAEHLKPANPLNMKIKKEVRNVARETYDETLQDKDERENIDPGSSEVSCPVCYKLVTKDRINAHLDTCLKVEERFSERKHMSKFVYHLLSDKEIKKKLKEQGLNASGDRQALVRRHKNFTTLYNANCDSLKPKPVSELIEEIEAQELEERLNSFPKQIQVHKNSNISEIEDAHDTYVKQHQSQFNALIEDVQHRELAQSIVKKEIQDENLESCGPLSNRLVDNYGNVIGETYVCEKKPLKPEPTVSQSVDKTASKGNMSERPKSISSGKEQGLLTVNIKQEPLSPSLVKEAAPFIKNMDKMQSSFHDSSSQSSDDLENSKIELNLLRKRKKDRISLEKQHSPKRK